MMMERYDHESIERKWQGKWERAGLFRAPDVPKRERKQYVLDMFPYPSAEGLHVGHPEGYTGSDIISRYLRMRGKTVLHPMGFDAFGLPAENYALKTGVHPAVSTKKNIGHMREQIKRLGFSYDWSREVTTSDPSYYKWTQWIFLKLFEHGLAYEAEAPINWCPKDKTGLANEEVVNGCCERCGTKVEKKNLRQWLVRITAYAEELLKRLDTLDWPENIKLLQRNWIGKSEGAMISFPMGEGKIETFTTRADTLFGATYLVLAPEHPLLKTLAFTNRKGVEKYVEQAKSKSDLERSAFEKEKTGVELKGVQAVNPATGKPIPIWVADYVLMGYGTAAVMAVPGHDERDFMFAKQYKLPIVKVIEPPKVVPKIALEAGLSPGGLGHLAADIESECWTGEGTMVRSGKFDGLPTEVARKKIVEWLQKQGFARPSVQYKLRDWVFSRQRYWGEPIPIIHCEKEGIVPLREEDLPLELPNVAKYEPTGTGEGPLANVKDWVNTICWRCGSKAKRETNTMPQWAGSNWYFLRYVDPRNDKQLASPDKLKSWLPVDLYIGGAEHAVLHLLYSRFIYKFLYKMGTVPKECGDEPFIRLKNQGLILGEDGQKMSKSRGNVINPDDIIKEYGSDTMRMYEMFMGPFADAKPWSTRGIVGVRRFLDRIWDLYQSKGLRVYSKDESGKVGEIEDSRKLRLALHSTIKSVTEDIDTYRFNTAVSKLMIFSRAAQNYKAYFSDELKKDFLKLLFPFAPHLAEELWERLGNKEPLATQPWPSYDERLLVESEVTVVIQVNGKVRDELRLASDASEADARAAALASAKIQKWLDGKTPRKFVYVKGKIISIVV